MKRFQMAIAFIALSAGAAFAQGPAAMTAQQEVGARLVRQSCGVCHTRPILNAKQFGPSLSKATFAQGDDQPKKQIADGSPNMPGFKYLFTAGQIDAIVAYLKTRDAPPAEPAKAP